MVDGDAGPYTRRTISGWQTSKGLQATGTLTASQTMDLVTEGLKARDSHGWALLVDDAIGFSVGIPTKFSTPQPPTQSHGDWWYEASGAFGHTVTVIPRKAACASMDDMFNALLSSPAPDREVTFQARKDDWFVVAGRRGEHRFYTRAQCRDQAIVRVILSVHASQAEALGFMFVAVANSLSLKPTLSGQAQPSPRIVFPPPPPGYAASSTGPSPPPPLTPQVPEPEPAPTRTPTVAVDKAGKTAAIRLTLFDGTELKPREVFERASETVYVVRTGQKQGSAVAISDRELVTNCHVLDSNVRATLERDGRKQNASLTSANPKADRCILTSDSPLPKWVRVRPYAEVKVGERAFSIGAPQGLEQTIAEGIVSAKRVIDGERLLQTSAPISRGSSGGGLFDAQGQLMGVTTWMRKDAQNLNFAIAAEEFAK
jgi:S1-C subfamily serine protease